MSFNLHILAIYDQYPAVISSVSVSTHSEGEYLPFFLHQNNLLLWIFQGWIFHDSPVGDFMHFLCILIHLLHAYLYCIYTYLLCL